MLLVTPGREQAIENIRRAALEGRFNDKTEPFDPQMDPERLKAEILRYVDRLGSPAFKLKNLAARAIVDLWRRRWSDGINQVVGMEKLSAVKGGAFITSNHFNPFDNGVLRRMSLDAGRGRLWAVSQGSNFIMPGLNGFEVLERVRSDENTAHIPVIVLTSEKAAEVESLQLGASDFISKPFNMPEVILARIKRAIELSEDTHILQATERDPLTDLYNPNLIRSSIGAVFTVPTVAAPSADIIAFLKARGISILTAQLQDSSLYYDVDMRRGTAIVMGTESTGLTNQWREAADAHIRIPMLGRLDSLNVSVSAAILLFEAVRQRQ